MPKPLEEVLSEADIKIKEPVNSKPKAEIPAKKGITYAFQDKLKKLPIPELEKSCQKYIDALKPLQTAREQKETEAAVHDFLKSDGPELQQKLIDYASDKSSYIEQFWYDSYLSYDNPVVLNLNPFFLLADDPTPARNNQVTRAASLVISSLSFVRALRKEELPPDNVRGQPLCMDQFTRIFGTSRIPTENGCVMVTDNTSKHMVVMCRSQFYWFDVLDDNSDLVMTEKDIVQNLRAIIKDASNTPIQEAARSAIGVLTTENRRNWANMREILTSEKQPVNKECLKIVDTALFILCLDDTEPSTLPEVSSNMLCGSNVIEKGVQIGTCTNRWYDKLQIIVCHNGSAGINFEHTGVDGHTILRLASDVYTDTILRFAKTINGASPSLWASTSPDPSKRDPASFGDVSTTPHKLEWVMEPEISLALRFAETRLADLICQNEFQTMEFEGYGMGFIKAMGFSPDAFVQMAFQAAYYGLYGRVECTYEPAMTKAFLHGRTEAIRTVSQESYDFVKKFCEDAPAEKKIDALKAACEKHVAITKDCAKGLGQDRHLYALFSLWQRGVHEEMVSNNNSEGASSPEDEGSPPRSPSSTGFSGPYSKHANVPAIFADPGWDKLNTTILSTSNCGNPSLRMFGFGPTSGDGFGIGYIIKEDSISVCASSKHRQTKRFVDTLNNYLLEVRRLLRETRPPSKLPTATRAREAEKRPSISERARGKAVVTVQGTVTPPSDNDDGGMLGGYGYFDVESFEKLFKKDPADGQVDKVVQARKAIGRKLRLAEY